MNSSASDINPVYQHSLAVSDLGQAIASYFSADLGRLSLKRTASLRTEIAHYLLNDALLIPKTIDNAVKSESKEYRLKQIRFVNCMIKNILSYCSGLEHDGVKEREYVHLLRKEVKLFRKRFKTWRKSLYSE